MLIPKAILTIGNNGNLPDPFQTQKYLYQYPPPPPPRFLKIASLNLQGPTVISHMEKKNTLTIVLMAVWNIFMRRSPAG